MPVRKYRSVEDMPPPPASSAALVDRIRAVWERARLLAPPPAIPRGVARFRTIEEANAARDGATLQRMRATRT